MNLLELRNRIRDKAIDNGLTYTEIETLFDVNLLLEQTMPCLMWRYSGETNNFDEVGTEMSLNVYLITTFPDSVRVETDTYQRDYIVTQQNALRTYFYNWLQSMPFESGDDYLEIISTEEIPIAERLGINEFLTVDFRVNISIKRDFCVDPEQIAPTPSQVQVYFNDVLRYTQACNVDLELILKNQDGDLINDATFTGYEIVVTQGGGQVTININGVLWDVIDAGETENIIVRQSSGSTQVGAKQGQYYRIADSVITLEDALGVTLSTTNVKAEDPATIVAPSARVSNSDDSYDVNVVSGGDLEMPDENITLNSGAFLTKPSVKNQDIELVDTSDVPITPDSVVGNKIVVDLSCADARVSNSDDSYDVNVASGGSLELPDSQINVNGSNEGNVVSVKTIDVNITDGTSPITPDAVSLSGNTLDIEVPSAGGSSLGAMPLQTGQTTSYATNDDGDLQRGRLTDFNTIPYNNPFSNTFRFTDELGGQAFTNNIIIDWSTWDGGTDVLGFCLSLYSNQTGTQNWANWMSNSPYTCSSFTGWYLANYQEAVSVFSCEDSFNYSPFNITQVFWTSTSNVYQSSSRAFAYTGQNTVDALLRDFKTNSKRALLTRTFTVTGTTLT